MARVRFLTIPKNEKGMEEYNIGISNSNNLIEKQLPEEEFDRLLSLGYLGEINKKCHVMVDDYESESIEGDNVQKCKQIMNGNEKEFPVFCEAIQTAIQYNTVLYTDF